jgi:hypothetical protein
MNRRAFGVRRVAAATVALVCLAWPGATSVTASSRPVDRLPQLLVLPSPDVMIGTSTTQPQMLPDQEVLYGCDPYEVSGGAQRCLRFDTLVVNAGVGALELRYDGSGVVQSLHAVQRIYRSDGSYVDRTAGSFYFDPAHQHFHYRDFSLSSLWRSDASGKRLGTRPVAQGRKDGFCLEDLDAYAATAPSAVYTYPTACYPIVRSDGSIRQINGISPGWLDVYDETLTNQSIEITGVADGYYLLQITVDPDRTMKLDPHSRLSVYERIRICGDQVDVVNRSHHCDSASAKPARDSLLGQHWRTACATGWCFQVPLVNAYRPSGFRHTR